jgi:hypothetical protein
MNVLHVILETEIGPFFTVAIYDGNGEITQLQLHKIDENQIVGPDQKYDMAVLPDLVQQIKKLIADIS